MNKIVSSGSYIMSVDEAGFARNTKITLQPLKVTAVHVSGARRLDVPHMLRQHSDGKPSFELTVKYTAHYRGKIKKTFVTYYAQSGIDELEAFTKMTPYLLRLAVVRGLEEWHIPTVNLQIPIYIKGGGHV